ncbi:hypothetical protein [Halocatena halophila]|uniref:hypothetical protein n=1 Tax=Halocatena halophila TaxID=2814576 RepID=UPI002ED62E4B
MTITTGVSVIFLLVGRILFGGLLAVTDFRSHTDMSELVQVAQTKGVPAPTPSVTVSNSLLVGGSAILVTPMIHNFWTVQADQREREKQAFEKGIMLLGAALVSLVVSGEPWAYSLTIGV